MWQLWGVEISASPLTWHIAYTTACCYRTKRDKQAVAAHFTVAIISCFWLNTCKLQVLFTVYCCTKTLF